MINYVSVKVKYQKLLGPHAYVQQRHLKDKQIVHTRYPKTTNAERHNIHGAKNASHLSKILVLNVIGKGNWCNIKH